MTALDDLLPPALPTRDHPLAGLTLLLVEDSRLACEGIRLLCRRSGARLRRADTLEAAERHLRAWRPSVAVVDLHLPDGSGLDLIRALARGRPRLDVLLATSGDPLREGEALAAGADAFLPKPATLLAFQSTILACLGPGRGPISPRAVPACDTPPDPTALREDLEHAAGLLGAADAPLDYVAGFLRGVARSASDAALAQGVEAMAATGATAPLLALLRDRLAAQPVI